VLCLGHLVYKGPQCIYRVLFGNSRPI